MIDPAGRDAIRGWLATKHSLDFNVLSGSMWPLVRQGDRVRVVRLAQPLRLGDIVLVELADRWVVHRVRRLGFRLTTKGDSAHGFDPPVEPEGVVGRVTAVRHGERWYELPRYPFSLVLAAVAISIAPLHSRLSRLAGAFAAVCDARTEMRSH